jgi:hypothetical protein
MRKREGRNIKRRIERKYILIFSGGKTEYVTPAVHINI